MPAARHSRGTVPLVMSCEQGFEENEETLLIHYSKLEQGFIVSKQMVADATQSGLQKGRFLSSSIRLTEFWNDLPRSGLGSNHPG